MVDTNIALTSDGILSESSTVRVGRGRASLTARGSRTRRTYEEVTGRKAGSVLHI